MMAVERGRISNVFNDEGLNLHDYYIIIMSSGGSSDGGHHGTG
jgi:hypothetical protein